MQHKKNKNPKKRLLKKTPLLLFVFMAIVVGAAVQGWAQYKGGSNGGDTESTLGSNIYSGGPQQGSSFSNSSAGGSLSHNAAVKLIFTVSPSSIVSPGK